MVEGLFENREHFEVVRLANLAAPDGSSSGPASFHVRTSAAGPRARPYFRLYNAATVTNAGGRRWRSDRTALDEAGADRDFDFGGGGRPVTPTRPECPSARIVARVEQRHAGHGGYGIGHAVAEIQFGGVAAASESQEGVNGCVQVLLRERNASALALRRKPRSQDGRLALGAWTAPSWFQTSWNTITTALASRSSRSGAQTQAPAIRSR